MNYCFDDSSIVKFFRHDTWIELEFEDVINMSDDDTIENVKIVINPLICLTIDDQLDVATFNSLMVLKDGEVLDLKIKGNKLNMIIAWDDLGTTHETIYKSYEILGSVSSQINICKV